MLYSIRTGNRSVSWFILLLVQFFILSSPRILADLNVFAAASLMEALKETAQLYQQRTIDKITFNFGASSTLARQIQAGAPADVFISADELKMNDLEKSGLVLKGTRRSLWSNSLVIVLAQDSALEFRSPQQLVSDNISRIALAEPRTVPSGIYARQYLQSIEIWNQITNKIVPSDNVRAALLAVESGNIEAGIVYRTDAAISRKVKVVWEVPTDQGPTISYPAAVLKSSTQLEAARKYLHYLASEEGKLVFRKFGFIILNP